MEKERDSKKDAMFITALMTIFCIIFVIGLFIGCLFGQQVEDDYYNSRFHEQALSDFWLIHPNIFILTKDTVCTYPNN